MKTVTIDFNDALAGYLGGASASGIATREVSLSDQGTDYLLTVLRQGPEYRLGLFDAQGTACPDFFVTLSGRRIAMEPDQESLDLGACSWLDMASLRLHVGERPVADLRIVPEAPILSGPERELARERLAAWQGLYALRTAAPLGVKDTGSETAAAWENALSVLAGALPAPRRPEPAAGQVWSLTPDLDGLDELGRYLRMPLVLVLHATHHVRVALCCPETALAAEGDVLLPDDSGREIGFVEPWNVRTLPRSALGECWAEVGEETAHTVRELASRLSPADENLADQADWRSAFLALEHDLGQACEQRALILHVAAQRRPGLLEQLRTKVHGVFANLHDALGDLLGDLGRPLQPALAADGDHIVGLLVLGENGSVEHHQAEITGWVVENGMLHLDGRLCLPDDVEPSFLVVTFTSDGNAPEQIMEPLAGDREFSVELPLPNGADAVSMDQIALTAFCYGR